ncbi:MAG: cytochrome C [Bacteroidia bacterium]
MKIDRLYILVMALVAVFMAACEPVPQPSKAIAQRFQNLPEKNPNDAYNIIDGIHVETGLVAEGDWLMVKQTCTQCHSAKLITQNRADAYGWQKMIKWMQETQGLWPLGNKEGKIINYLATHYAPQNTGRRKALAIEEWYDIE